MKFVPFNINGNVRVKLTPKGVAILHEAHEALRAAAPSIGPWRPPEVDAEGFTHFQAWGLMEAFGPHISIGMNNTPFETNIQIEVDDDARVGLSPTDPMRVALELFVERFEDYEDVRGTDTTDAWQSEALTSLVEKGKAALAGSASNVARPSAWLILFDDAEVKPEVFTGNGAERAARERFKALSDNWNAHLFALAESNTSPATMDVEPVGACPEGARELLIEADNFIDAFLEDEGTLHPDLEGLHTRIVTWLAGSAPKMACLWIAVSERAPQAQFDVLVSDGRYIGIGDCCKGHLWNSTTIEGPVTHWMPLPVAPGSAPKERLP